MNGCSLHDLHSDVFYVAHRRCDDLFWLRNSTREKLLLPHTMMPTRLGEPQTQYLFVPAAGNGSSDPNLRGKVRSYLIRAHHRNRRAQEIIKFGSNKDVSAPKTTKAPQVSSQAGLDVRDSLRRPRPPNTDPPAPLDFPVLNCSGFLPVQLVSGDSQLIDICMYAGIPVVPGHLTKKPK